MRWIISLTLRAALWAFKAQALLSGLLRNDVENFSMTGTSYEKVVIPGGVTRRSVIQVPRIYWIPAFAGMTTGAPAPE
jgi:hypothetical protein